MTLFELADWFPRLLRKRKRLRGLREASSWPLLDAKVVKSIVVLKDPAADEGTNLQTSQIESAFYFTLNGDFHGGHLRSLPVSDSEAHRLLPKIAEDAGVRIRYNPADPAQTHALAEDNTDTLPFPLWSM